MAVIPKRALAKSKIIANVIEAIQSMLFCSSQRVFLNNTQSYDGASDFPKLFWKSVLQTNFVESRKYAALVVEIGLYSACALNWSIPDKSPFLE